MPRTPSAVLTRIGKHRPKAMTDDARGVAGFEDDECGWHDRDRGHRSKALEKRVERAPDGGRGPHQETESDADGRRDGQPNDVPLHALPHLRQEVRCRPLVPGPLCHLASRRHEDVVFSSRPELPDAQDGDKDEQTECVTAEAASGSGPHCADRSSPAQKSVRRWTARSPTLTR